MARPRLRARTSSTSIRVDETLKKEAEEICASMGLTLSSAYTLLLKAIVNTRSFPFMIKAAEPVQSNENVK